LLLRCYDLRTDLSSQAPTGQAAKVTITSVL
jgi:hypothetical protein